MSWKPGESIFVSSLMGGTQTAARQGGQAGGQVVQEIAPPPQRRPVNNEWRRWIAENLLLHNDPNSIVTAMVKEGFGQQDSVAEVRAAMEHPYIAAASAAVQKGGTGQDLTNKLKKRDWVLECYRRAERQSSMHGQVPRIHRPSREEFLDAYYALNRPVVIQGAFDDWAARTEWTGENLKRRFGDRRVEVQGNRDKSPNYEIDQVKFRQEMSFGEFVDITETAGQTNNYYITANNSGKNKEALKEVWGDIKLLPYLKEDPANNGFFWFGPAGTVTPLHHDLTNNFMAQVRGRKLVKLIAPYDYAYLYNNRHCYSPVDPENPDYEKYPLFKEATVIDCTIGPGDLLFLPIGWWHHVRGLDISITMTFTNFVYDNDFFSFYSTYNQI